MCHDYSKPLPPPFVRLRSARRAQERAGKASSSVGSGPSLELQEVAILAYPPESMEDIRNIAGAFRAVGCSEGERLYRTPCINIYAPRIVRGGLAGSPFSSLSNSWKLRTGITETAGQCIVEQMPSTVASCAILAVYAPCGHLHQGASHGQSELQNDHCVFFGRWMFTFANSNWCSAQAAAYRCNRVSFFSSMSLINE